YSDGELVSTGGAPAIQSNDNPMMIGQNPDTGNRTWDGLIDDVGIWDRPITGEEVATIYNGGAGTPLISNPTVATAMPVPGLIAYWPLDEITGETTPDVVSGYDMSLTNIDDSNVVEGKVGNAFSFSNADQTLLSYVSEGEDDDLPANKHDSFAISFWSKVQGTGQNDLRLFSESNTLGDNNPLFNIGTRNNGSDGTIDIYIRGAGPTVGHIFSTAEPFDGEWHHVVFVQNELARSIYVDGLLDDLEIAAKPDSGWDNIDATTIGGILRGNASHWVTGLIDEVGIWDRPISEEEVALIYNDG
ncbi:MAG: LamG domain-containing protein, partial [Planctomycetaceae bacterium]|nr:LamG domain-containing protein [Planctomycetaceae bacterium]